MKEDIIQHNGSTYIEKGVYDYDMYALALKKDKEIKRLNKCYCERTDCSGRIKNSKKYESMQEEIERLNKQIEECQKALDETMSEKIDLENIKKEAIEYLKKHACYEEDTKKFCRDLDYGECLGLLNILRGEE